MSCMRMIITYYYGLKKLGRDHTTACTDLLQSAPSTPQCLQLKLNSVKFHCHVLLFKWCVLHL